VGVPWGSKKAKIVAEQNDGIELGDDSPKVIDGTVSNVFHAAQACRLDGARGPIETDDVNAALLKREGNTTRATSDIDHAATHGTKSLALGGGPVLHRGQVHLGTSTALHEAIFSFDDFWLCTALRPVKQRPTEDIAHAVSSA
jgi:hypothetical protein